MFYHDQGLEKASLFRVEKRGCLFGLLTLSVLMFCVLDPWFGIGIVVYFWVMFENIYGVTVGPKCRKLWDYVIAMC